MQNQPQHEGKPPKESSQMRTVLKSVHAANAATEPGQHRTGLAADSQLHLTWFHSQSVAREFQRMLNQAGIPSRLKRARQQSNVYVDMEDRDRAQSALAMFRKSTPDEAPPAINQRFDFLILGLVTGVTLGIVLSLATLNTLLDILRVGMLAAMGALIGHLGDRLFHRQSRGFLMFGVYEFMILAVIPALAIVIWKITPALLFK